MKIKKYMISGEPTSLGFELNEAYFRFELSVYYRVDDQGENSQNFSPDQKTLIAKLMELKEKKTHIFRKVIFNKNEIVVTLIYPWTDQLITRVENIIRWSWPQLFIHANPS